MIYNDQRTAKQRRYPYVNNNGDTKSRLIEDRRATLDALKEALKFLCAQYPHGRNYQSGPAGAYEQARAIHQAHCDSLQDIIDDIQAEAIFISVHQ